MAQAKSTQAVPKAAARRAISRTPAVKSLPAGESTPEADSQLFRRNDLLDAVAERSAMPRSDLRSVIELVLDEMGKALSEGQNLALHPLGRVKIQRRKDGEEAEVLSLRLRRKTDVGSDDAIG